MTANDPIIPLKQELVSTSQHCIGRVSGAWAFADTVFYSVRKLQWETVLNTRWRTDRSNTFYLNPSSPKYCQNGAPSGLAISPNIVALSRTRILMAPLFWRSERWTCTFMSKLRKKIPSHHNLTSGAKVGWKYEAQPIEFFSFWKVVPTPFFLCSASK